MPVANLDLAVDQAAEIQHIVVREELHITRIRRRGDQMRVQVVKPVRQQSDAETCRRRRDATELGDSAANASISLQNRGAAPLSAIP